MSEELKQAARLFDKLMGHDVLGHWEVVQMPSNNPKVRLYGNGPTLELTIGITPIAAADGRDVHIQSQKMAQRVELRLRARPGAAVRT